MSRAYVALVIALAILAALTGAAAVGWHARAVVAERDALRELEQQTKVARAAQHAANRASVQYIDARDALQPVIHLVRVSSTPVVRILDSCSLPADARGLLDHAADAADCRASDCAALPARATPDSKSERAT
jgi:type II secretory pathway pseudopilin PulG